MSTTEEARALFCVIDLQGQTNSIDRQIKDLEKTKKALNKKCDEYKRVLYSSIERSKSHIYISNHKGDFRVEIPQTCEPDEKWPIEIEKIEFKK